MGAPPGMTVGRGPTEEWEWEEEWVPVGTTTKVEVGETVVLAVKEETAEEISEAMEDKKLEEP